MRERRKDYEIQFIKDHVESLEDLPERNRHQIRGSIAQSMAVSESGRDQRKADPAEQNGSRSGGTGTYLVRIKPDMKCFTDPRRYLTAV